ncbi:fluoride efflux transporter FluC [Plantibacter sp. Mn2098]|uniref:fluoride efflux transporter FluC n=1 Tax=Plantibacter sp. Mn2098 TaxID=3395266 RepID=UPI003BE33E59
MTGAQHPADAFDAPIDDRALPVDSDIEIDDRPGGSARPIHLRWQYLALVAAGGTIGTAAREALSLAIPPVSGIPVAILSINVAGAFTLGVLLEALARRGPDAGTRRTLRLFLGTGFLGGFTTYSALAADTAVLLVNGDTGTGVLYALATVLLGAAASTAGIAAGTELHRRHTRALTQTKETA